MRLDKFLSECNIGTRSQVKELIRKSLVSVNGTVVKSPDQKIDENQDEIVCQGVKVSYKKYVYIMLNKPAGVVSATNDPKTPTVLDLIKPNPVKGMFPFGRLDKDTTGLLIISNDGALSHKLLSPKFHVEKRYLVHPKNTISQADISLLEEGVDIGDEKLTAPAKVNVLYNGDVCLTITEGRFHQVKRMFEAIDNEVLTLKRLSFGPIDLDTSLKEGEWRELTEDEISKINLI